MFLNQNYTESDITNGLRTAVLKMIDNAIKNNSVESFYSIDGFIMKILNLSISNKYLVHFREYIEVCIFYYTLSYNYKYSNNAGYNKIFDACSDRAAQRIRESFLLMNFTYEKSNLIERNTINEFKLRAFTAFSQLLYEQIKRKDIKQFTSTVNQLEQAETIGYHFDRYDFLIKLNRNEYTEDELNIYRTNLQSNHYYQHTILGVKYWLYYLYENNQFSMDEMKDFLIPINQALQDSHIKQDYWEIELLFNFLNSRALAWYLNWQSWDYVEHADGKPYTMQSPFDWFFKGVVIDAIQNQSFSNSFPIDCNQIEKQHPQNKLLLIHTLREKIKAIQIHEKWQVFFKNEINTQIIEQQLNQLNASFEIRNAKEIVASNLIQNKVFKFKQDFYNSWNERKSLSIRKLFDYFNKKMSCEDRPNELFVVGTKLFLERGKRFFLNLADDVLGVDTIAKDRGADLSLAEDRLFFDTIFKSKQEKIYNDLIVGLDTCIANLRKNKREPDAIFLNHWDIYVNLERENNSKWSPEKKTELSVGTYDNISVFEYTYHNILQNRFIVADFTKAFKMLYREIPDAFDSVLKIDIKEISDEMAKDKLQKEPDKWKNIDGQQLSDEDALIYIKTSILIDYEVIDLFEIDDINAFEIGLIEK